MHQTLVIVIRDTSLILVQINAAPATHTATGALQPLRSDAFLAILMHLWRVRLPTVVNVTLDIAGQHMPALLLATFPAKLVLDGDPPSVSPAQAHTLS